MNITEQTARELQNELGVLFFSFDQGNRRALADSLLRQLILERKLSHDNNPALSAHLANCGARVQGESKLRITKKSRNALVDGAVALSMCVHEFQRLML